MDWIYLDHNSTTPLLAAVADAMAPWQRERFGNPASQHQAGRRARQALEKAREQIGEMLGADVMRRQGDRLLFTSGGTEANHLALHSLAAAAGKPAEAILSAIEHPSVQAPAQMLEARGWTIHRLRVTSSGVVDFEHFEQLLNDRTRWVSVMLANNETGVLQPVVKIVERCAERGVPVHTDAAQAVAKVPIDFARLGASFLTVAPHKFHGPLGVGALVCRGGVAIEPLLGGGFQQEGLRAGTESVALAVGFHAALAAWRQEWQERAVRMQSLRDRLENGLKAALPGVVAINGQEALRLPQTSSVAFLGYDRQALLMALDLAGVLCSTGAACASGSSEPSAVLSAMGVSPAALRGSLRFSLGATTTAEEIDAALARIVEVCRKLPRSN